jgi:hypothetical protein
MDDQCSGTSRAGRTSAAARLEVRLTHNLIEDLSMHELREQFNSNNAGRNEDGRLPLEILAFLPAAIFFLAN